MGKTRYNKVKEILRDIVGQTYHKNKMWRRIMIHIGSDERTLRETMRLMITLGLIQEVKENYYKVLNYKADI